MLRVYGIKNCDTVRKTLKWLEQRSVPHEFHDFRVDGLDEDVLRGWLESPLGDDLLNRRSATWRKLGEAERQGAESDPAPVMLANPTLIRRPVITDGEAVCCVGFSDAKLESIT